MKTSFKIDGVKVDPYTQISMLCPRKMEMFIVHFSEPNSVTGKVKVFIENGNKITTKKMISFERMKLVLISPTFFEDGHHD